MKIAFLGPAPPYRGGIARFALMLAIEYLRTGQQVKMFTFERQYPALLFPGGAQTTEYKDLPELPIQKVYTPHNPFSWNKAVKAIRAYAPDLVIVSFFLPWFIPADTWICKRLKGIRIAYLVHNLEFHERWIGANLLSRRAFEHCDRIVVLSAASLRSLRDRMPASLSGKAVQGFHPIYDCYQGELDFGVSTSTAGQTVLFFGLIKSYKGLDVLLKAVALASRKLPQIKLLIAGEVYGKREQYLKLIADLKLENRVEANFRYIGDSEIASYFTRSQVCVLPYKSATQSGVIATAYSFNLPVIASRIGGLGEYIEEGVTGLLVPPDDPEALAAALIRYFEDGLLQSLSDNIPAYKARFSWQKLADLILED